MNVRKRNHHLHLKHNRWFVSFNVDGQREWFKTGTADVRVARRMRDEMLAEHEAKQAKQKEQPVVAARKGPPEVPTESRCGEVLNGLRFRTGQPNRLDESKYYVAGCVVLLAAVYATREAYEWASEQLPRARAIDARRRAS